MAGGQNLLEFGRRRNVSYVMRKLTDFTYGSYLDGLEPKR